MAEFPHMPFFTDAYLADTIHLTTEEHGAYMLLLITMWRTPDCSLPNDDKRLALYTRLSLAKWKKVRIVLEDFLTISDDKISQKRLQKERKFVSDKTQKNRDNGMKGGRPKLLKTNEHDKANGSGSDNPTQNPNESQKKAPIPTPIKKEKKSTFPPDKPFEVEPDNPHAGDLSLYGGFLVALDCQNNFQMAGKFGIFQSWLSYGCDYQLDILPVCLAVKNRQEAKSQKISMGYLTPAVQSAHDERIRTGKSTASVSHETVSPEQWGERMTNFRGWGTWSKNWGPEPGEPGCLAPPELEAAQ